MERLTGLRRFGQAIPGAGFIGYIEKKCTQFCRAGTVSMLPISRPHNSYPVKIGSDKDMRPKQYLRPICYGNTIKWLELANMCFFKSEFAQWRKLSWLQQEDA
jgi:hypothetical protein